MILWILHGFSWIEFFSLILQVWVICCCCFSFLLPQDRLRGIQKLDTPVSSNGAEGINCCCLPYRSNDICINEMERSYTRILLLSDSRWDPPPEGYMSLAEQLEVDDITEVCCTFLPTSTDQTWYWTKLDEGKHRVVWLLSRRCCGPVQMCRFNASVYLDSWKLDRLKSNRAAVEIGSPYCRAYLSGSRQKLGRGFFRMLTCRQ